jgi:hypothetical protein
MNHAFCEREFGWTVKCLFNDAVRIEKKNDLCVFMALMEGLFTKVLLITTKCFVCIAGT